jgi:hypothetical protein
MEKMKKTHLLAILLFFGLNSYSQKEIVSQNNAWIMFYGNHKLSKNWGIHTEYQWRRADFFNSWQQSLMRLGLEYYTNNGIQLTAGYGWIKSFPYGEQPIPKTFDEHRIWQQLIFRSNYSRIKLDHRYRLEQRFLENWILNSDEKFELEGFRFKQRVRYRLQVVFPLNNKEMIENTLFFSLYDEIFLGFGKGIGNNIFDQNRLYGALGWRFDENTNVQLGYKNQFIVKTDGVQMERNHTFQLGITYNMDFTKKD